MTDGIDVAAFRRAERQRLLAARDATDADARAGWSDAITRLLAERIEALAPRMLGFYWPHRGEYDPVPVISRVIERGGQVALPLVVAKTQPLEYRAWRPGMEMTPSRRSFGILYPAQGPAVTPDAMLIPLLGFDGYGYRLGYGGGYFDRTLAAFAPRPMTIGVGFELGRLATIHPQPHDIPMDMIVTEQGVQRMG
jgi:5-formyltetrahydrofolate cyclo-ligase